jgi:mannose-6-phosphate isomerase-like protein (cupin superfamily)
MKHLRTSKHRGFFRVLISARAAQAAMMVLRPGQSTSDEPENEHPRSEQWLYVISGSGRATTGKRRVTLRAGSLLLIEQDEPHQITAGGRVPLVTLNLYAPPAYTRQGDVRLRARRPSLTRTLGRLVRG